MSRDSQMRSLGDDLRELVPLITEAVLALDKPGSRALRRKIDSAFNSAVHSYNAAWNIGLYGRDWSDLIAYTRVTPLHWGGRRGGRPAGLRLFVNGETIETRRSNPPHLSVINGGDDAA